MRHEQIRVGRIVSAHGVRGEVRVLPEDGGPETLARFHTFYLDGVPVKPQSVRAHKGMALIKFPGVEDCDAALALKGKPLYISRTEENLPDSVYFDEELIGMEVRDGADGSLLGELTAVEHYPASRVYTVRGEKTYLIPAVPEAFILSVDIAANRMEVRRWEGMATDEN